MSESFALHSKRKKHRKQQLQRQNRAITAVCIAVSSTVMKRSRAIEYIDCRFDFLGASDATMRFHFRFTLAELQELTQLLEIPDIVITSNRYKASSIEALSSCLAKLATPARYGDLSQILGTSRERLCGLNNHILFYIYQHFKHLLDWDPVRLNAAYLRRLADAVHAAGSPMTCVVGFIDGTVRGMVRPGNGVQKTAYNGHKVCVFC